MLAFYAGTQQFPMFNPTAGFLTQVDMSFYYTTAYGGTLSNMSGSTSPEAWFQDTGSKTAWFNFTPVGTMWSHSAPSEGRVTSYLPPWGSGYFTSTPNRGYGSPTYSITDPDDVRLFVGVGNDNSLIQAFISSSYNLATSPLVRIVNWQQMFAPRATITYHYNPFPPAPTEGGGGLSFSVAEGPSYGQGQVEPTPLGVSHKHKVQAFPGQQAVIENTGAVQQFTFSREDQGSQQTSVFINGLLDGFLSAQDNATARALNVMELYNADGQLVDRAERLAVADSQVFLGQPQDKNVHDLFGMTVMLLPGHVYELRSKLHLTADPRGAGSALADFSNTFDMELSGMVPEHVRFVEVPTDTIWVRDFGPIFLRRTDGTTIALDAEYQKAGRKKDNHAAVPLARCFKTATLYAPILLEGGDLLGNGRGLCVTTTAAVNRNISRGYDRATITKYFRNYLGSGQIVLLEPLRGETTGHVDVFACFTDSRTIVVGAYQKSDDPVNAALLDRNAALLTKVRTAGGKLRVVRVPMPNNRDDLWRTYTNGLFANGLLLLPRYPRADPAAQRKAFETFRSLLPGWDVVGIDADKLIAREGALRCITLHVPLGHNSPEPGK